MRKGVAVGYIIALILGVVVIALIGIWFVTSGGKFSGVAGETACRGKALEFCIKSPSGSVADWTTIRVNTVCDLTSLGIKHGTEEKPDCSKILK